MKRTQFYWSVPGRPVIVLILIVAASVANADDEFGANPTWKIPTTTDVRQQFSVWLETQDVKPDLLDQIDELWKRAQQEASSDKILDLVADSFALIHDDSRKIVELCAQFDYRSATPPEFPWLDSDQEAPLLRNNLRLLYARWLARHRYYDECLALIEDLQPQDVIDPSTLLFYQTVVQHRLLKDKESMESIDQLLTREDEIPRRYQQLAGLMKDDIAGLEVDSLDHIARRMEDVERRLDLGRAGEKVREVEDGVIASLDKLIKEMEDAAQQAQAAGNGAGGAQSPMPAGESRILGGRGPGKVDKRGIGDQSDWGNLPKKQREEAMQQIGREFPSHYRDVIEQYFKKLASE